MTSVPPGQSSVTWAKPGSATNMNAIITAAVRTIISSRLHIFRVQHMCVSCREHYEAASSPTAGR
jgi:hypothetical protein